MVGVGFVLTREPAALAGDPSTGPPTESEIQEASEKTFDGVPSDALLTLTIDEIGIENAPVRTYTGDESLNSGVTHEPDTSLPWTDTEERNVYLMAHRVGVRDTDGYLMFYRLDELEDGDVVSVTSPEGREYSYRIFDKFVVDPSDSWVLGRQEGRDMLSLQTCAPLSSLDRRLIIWAERI